MPRITPVEVDRFIQKYMDLLIHNTAMDLLKEHKEVVKEFLSIEYLVDKNGKPETFADLEEACANGKFGDTKFFVWLKNAKKKKVLTIKELPKIKKENTAIIKKTVKTIKKQEVKQKEKEGKDKIIVYNTPIEKTIHQTTIKTQINLKTKMATDTLRAIEGQIKNIKVAQRYILDKHKKDYAEVITVQKTRKKRLDKTIKALDKQFYEYQQCLEKTELELQVSNINDAEKQNKDKLIFYKNNIKDLLDMQEKFQKLENQYFEIMDQTYKIRDKIANEIYKLPESLVKMQLAIKGIIENENSMKNYDMLDIDVDSDIDSKERGKESNKQDTDDIPSEITEKVRSVISISDNN